MNDLYDLHLSGMVQSIIKIIPNKLGIPKILGIFKGKKKKIGAIAREVESIKKPDE